MKNSRFIKMNSPQQFEVIETSILYDSVKEIVVNSSVDNYHPGYYNNYTLSSSTKVLQENDDTTINRETSEISESNNTSNPREEHGYSSEEDKEVSRKPMGPPCSCRLGCYNKVPEEIRKRLYDNFWNNCNGIQRKQYIALSIKETPKSRSRCRGPVKTERRQLTCTYLLLVNDQLVKVCKGMFLNTFAVSEKIVRLVMSKKRSSTNGIAGMDLKVKQVKKSDAVKEMIREHIMSFPAEVLPGDNSGKRYLDASLNVSAMHKMYVKQCQEKGVSESDIVRQGYYREIFKSDFNLCFKCKEMF